MKQEFNRLVSIRDVANCLRTSPKKISQLLEEGELDAVRTGPRSSILRVHEDDFFPDSFLLVSEAATKLGVSDTTVYRRIKAGQMSAMRLGGSILIRKTELERYMSAHSMSRDGLVRGN